MKFRSLLFLGALTGTVLFVQAQVVTPTELNDPKLQRLQQREFRTLVDIGGEIQRYPFPYPFYLSKVLDISQIQQVVADEGIRESDLTVLRRAGIKVHVAAYLSQETEYVSLAH